MAKPTYQPRLSRRHGPAAARLDAFPWREGLLLRATNWLGDTLMTLPAAYKLSRQVPESRAFCVLCPASLAPLWRSAPWVSRVIPLHGRRVSASESHQVKALRAGAAVVFPNSFGAAWDVFLKGIPVRAGRAGRGRGWMLTHRLPEWRRTHQPADCHQLSYYLELADVFGDISWDGHCPPLTVDGVEDAVRGLGLSPGADRWLIIAPGAAYGPAKQWPAEHFADVAAWWRKTVGPVAVVGTEQERMDGQLIRDCVPGTLNLAGRTDLGELMAVLSVADMIVANDSGAMHLGAGLGRAGVAIFGSTDPVATGPIGGTWIVLHEPPECAPCFERRCPRHDRPYECLRRIEPGQVIAALRTLMDGNDPGD